MGSSNIYIFSRPVRSGKTTALKQWVKQQDAVAGILTPDIDGKRMLLDVSGNQLFPLQTEVKGDDAIIIGRFLFLKEGFEKGRKILETAAKDVTSWLVIDEIGKLEIERNEGWEPAVTHVIRTFSTLPDRKLLLVVRDSLLDAARERYHLQEASVIHDLTEIR